MRIRSAGQECPALADSGRQECLPHQTLSISTLTLPENAHAILYKIHDSRVRASKSPIAASATKAADPGSGVEAPPAEVVMASIGR